MTQSLGCVMNPLPPREGLVTQRPWCGQIEVLADQPSRHRKDFSHHLLITVFRGCGDEIGRPCWQGMPMTA